jgi:hypothetical protein
MAKNQTDLTNETAKKYAFLSGMSNDKYYPTNCVDKGKQILVNLCAEIETQKPQNLDELYRLTHAATNKFNSLEREFAKQGSEIETMARECIALDFDFVARTYGFEKADLETLIAPREW